MSRIFLQETDRIIVIEERTHFGARAILFRALLVVGVATGICFLGRIA